MTIRPITLTVFLAGVAAMSLSAHAQFGFPTGACCQPDGDCIVTTSINCWGQAGLFQGGGSTCADAVCSGGCCLPDGACSDVSASLCSIQQGIFMGLGNNCDTHATACYGACCGADGSCGPSGHGDCSGTFAGLATSCATAECTGACCQGDGTCAETGAAGCAAQGGSFHGGGSTCSEVSDQCTGACCNNDGTCVQATSSTCGGGFWGLGVACEEVSCLGACCVPDGSCHELSHDECLAISGTPQGEGSTCDTAACPVPTGFTYQGRLVNAQGAYDGPVDLRFSLWDAFSGGEQVGESYMVPQVEVVDGLFTAYVDFGVEVFNGQTTFLEVAVQPAGEADIVTLSPRQPIAAVPYSLQTRGLFVDEEGSVGVGTTDPIAALDVVDNGFLTFRARSAVTGRAAVIGEHSSTETNASSIGVRGESRAPFAAGVLGVSTADNGKGVWGYAQSPGGFAAYFEGGRNYFENNVGIGKLPEVELDVDGTTRTKVIEITGGADIAESFDIAAAGGVSPIAGMVVSIDPARPGSLRVCDTAYDRAVAGIISGAGGVNPGLTLSQRGSVADGNLPVASIGRVWCLVDADANGPIVAGDLLTSSPTAGHAMRVTDDRRANGAILGKAMTALEQGKGLVLVLVALQ